jgi:phosphogluconate dehydratase
MGPGLRQYTREPSLDDKGQLVWNEATLEPRNPEVLRPTSNPFSADGGLKVLSGNIGRSVIKISSIKPEYRHIEAPAIVFNDQNELQEAFKRGELEKDFIAVVRYQGPRACGMPELHRLTPPLGVLLEKGFKVALVTDGRMSGASGKIPAAIHVSPEAASGGPIALVQTGDMMRLDIETGALDVIVDAEEWAARKPADVDLSANTYGVGRELFAGFRAIATTAEEGATSFALPQWENK